MGNWKPWTYPAAWSLEEHNAVLAELRKAEAELERMGRANNEACDRIAEQRREIDKSIVRRDAHIDVIHQCEKRIEELERENAEHRSHVSTVMSREAALKRAITDIETQLDIVTRDRDHYREEYQPVSAARDAAEARVRELESQLAAVRRVDPDAWRTELHIGCATAIGSDWFQLCARPHAGKVEAAVSASGMTCCSDILPADAARAAVCVAGVLRPGARRAGGSRNGTRRAGDAGGDGGDDILN